MSLYLRVIQPADLEEIIDFEKSKLRETIVDEMDRELHSWNARWRQESLQHYLPMGWSFLARDRNLQSSFSSEGQLVGYFLAQPLLFFDGQTQSLWVEHMQYATLQSRDELCELAYKLSREKHFQKVFFPESQSILNAVKSFKAQNWDPQVLLVHTTKAST
jgi:hypothetical protein